MRWLAYALFCEGSTDRSYCESLLPKVMEYLLTRHKTHDDVDVPPEPSVRLGAQGREVDAVAREACDAQGAFDIVFVHADTGGRSQHARIGSRSSAYCMRMRELCDMPVERCILVQPRHETEAWALADADAVAATLGYRGSSSDLGLPEDPRAAERESDPKAVLRNAVRAAGARPSDALLPGIADRQSISALQRMPSFREFEDSLLSALYDLGMLRQ